MYVCMYACIYFIIIIFLNVFIYTHFTTYTLIGNQQTIWTHNHKRIIVNTWALAGTMVYVINNSLYWHSTSNILQSISSLAEWW